MIKTNRTYYWYGVAAVIIGSLNATLIKYASESLNPFMINIIRYSLGVICTFPFFLISTAKLSKRNLIYSFMSGVCLFLGTIGYISAISLSKASYVTLLTLLGPIVLVLLSIKLTKDKVDTKRLAGFSLAALGAVLVVVGPLIVYGNTSIDFYPLATALAFITIISYQFSVIFARKANESRKKLPLLSVLFIQTSVIVLLSLLSGLAFNQVDVSTIPSINGGVLLAIVYSGLMVGVVDRALNIKSYEKVGSAVNGGLVYFGIFLSISISVVTLGEKISLIALTGGVIILLGIVLTEHKLPIKHRHNLHNHRIH